MTYVEIDNYIHKNFAQRKQFILSLNVIDRASWLIHEELYGRGGYDQWWDGIENDIQNEIFEKIKNIIKLEFKNEQN